MKSIKYDYMLNYFNNELLIIVMLNILIVCRLVDGYCAFSVSMVTVVQFCKKIG